MEKLTAYWRVQIPDELRCYWLEAKSFEGFCGDKRQGEYVQFYSARDALTEFGLATKEFMPSGFLPLGSNGSGELIVYSENIGYGLLGAIHGGAADFVLVADTLAGFWQKSVEGNWL
ncbi:hypothetical protein [Roseovarius aestuarii]|uniref:hypothetical protein n=1 Tax=Roseovarius aestuarii TaxID=475083 RepID=UPI0036407390